MSKNVRNQLVKETSNFLNCDLGTAEKKADEWVATCKNIYQEETNRQARKLVKEMDNLKCNRNEAEGEEMLKDILVVAAERTATKEE